MSFAHQAPPSVLVFSGSDPSGGAGMQADITAIAALGAHPFSVPTVLTVQDNERVFGVHPLPPELVRQQAQVLIDRFRIDAVKLGMVGNRANAEVIAEMIHGLRARQPELPVVFDPVLANNGGDALSLEEPIAAIAPLFALASVITPNRIEAQRLCDGATGCRRAGPDAAGARLRPRAAEGRPRAGARSGRQPAVRRRRQPGILELAAPGRRISRQRLHAGGGRRGAAGAGPAHAGGGGAGAGLLPAGAGAIPTRWRRASASPTAPRRF